MRSKKGKTEENENIAYESAEKEVIKKEKNRII